MTFSYVDAVKLLTSSGKFHINLGLERVKAAAKLFDNPQDKYKIIHVAGTNGKGSCCCALASILSAVGLKTGLYTSPHLVSYTERIKINSSEISKEDFAKYISIICNSADENNIDLTEFEILTVAAFKYFADNKVDIAIIETGMGGRCDATNIVKSPAAEIITSVSFDHTDRLGKSIEEIAFEKAGIIKQNSRVIVSAYNKGFDVIKKVAEEKNTKIIKTFDDAKIVQVNGKSLLNHEDKLYECALTGEYQTKNMPLVFKTIEYLKETGLNIDEKALKTGLKNINLRARFEYNKEKNFIIDGAHNPDAAFELRKSLDANFPGQKRIFIYSTLNTKDYKTISEMLFRDSDEIFYLEFEHKNAVSYEEYKSNTKLKNLRKTQMCELPGILKKDGLKVLTGSLYMTGEVLTRFSEL